MDEIKKNEFRKTDDESFDEYMMRIGNACSERKLTWDQAAVVLNEATNSNFGECAYRKKYKSWKAGYDYALEHMCGSTVADELQRLKIEQVKMRDERAATNKVYRDIARAESIKEMIASAVVPYDKNDFLNIVQYEGSGHDLIVCLSDLHTGVGIDSAWNKFDKEILKARLESYVTQVFNIVERHAAEKIHVLLLGDLINGHIHINTRVQNNENSIEQVMTAAELVSNFVAELYEVCQHIDVYSVSGNHSRVFPNKEEQVAGDELEALIPFYMKARLQNLAGIEVKTEKLDPTFGGFKARNSLVMYAHGDKDSPANVVEHLTMMVKQPIDLVFLGHRHTNGMTTVHGTKVIESGCVCGTDGYAVGIRKNDIPQQAVAVIADDGLTCLYRGFSKNSDRWHRLRPALAYFHSEQDNDCQISYKTNDFSQSRKVKLHRVLLSTSSRTTGFPGSPYDNVHMIE